MKPLIIISHTPSPNTITLADAARRGAKDYAEGRDIYFKTPLEVQVDDLTNASGLILGTTENIGAMAGLTKDMFDRCYNDWLGTLDGLPVGIYIRAGLDGTATNRQLQAIASALKWRLIQDPVILQGAWQASYVNDVYELAGSLAAGLDAGIYG